MNPLRSELWLHPWAEYKIEDKYDLWIDLMKLSDFKEPFEVNRTPGKQVSDLMLES